MGSTRGPVGSTERTGGPLGMHWSPYWILKSPYNRVLVMEFDTRGTPQLAKLQSVYPLSLIVRPPFATSLYLFSIRACGCLDKPGRAAVENSKLRLACLRKPGTAAVYTSGHMPEVAYSTCFHHSCLHHLLRSNQQGICTLRDYLHFPVAQLHVYCTSYYKASFFNTYPECCHKWKITLKIVYALYAMKKQLNVSSNAAH